jgi:hypothetical protein
LHKTPAVELLVPVPLLTVGAVVVVVVVLSLPPPQADTAMPASRANASAQVGLMDWLECFMNLLLEYIVFGARSTRWRC